MLDRSELPVGIAAKWWVGREWWKQVPRQKIWWSCSSISRPSHSWFPAKVSIYRHIKPFAWTRPSKAWWAIRGGWPPSQPSSFHCCSLVGHAWLAVRPPLVVWHLCRSQFSRTCWSCLSWETIGRSSRFPGSIWPALASLPDEPVHSQVATRHHLFSSRAFRASPASIPSRRTLSKHSRLVAVFRFQFL